MLHKKERTEGTLVGLGILVLGIAIGNLVRPTSWFQRRVAPRASPALSMVPVTGATSPVALGLPVLELSIPEASAEVLQRVREDALERGIIVQTDEDTVPAELIADGERHPVDLRIKGDWTDHVEGERWSYRIHIKGASYRGMREFSIQAPSTRGYLWEWFVHEAGRREGLLAPRSNFVAVIQNGHPMGVYYLEEHFSKEMLEFQGRREGPIVRWDEGTFWATLLAEGDLPSKGRRAVPSEVQDPARTLAPAVARAFGEKRLSSIEGLEAALAAALDQMKALRALTLTETPDLDRMIVLQALKDLRGRVLEDVVHVERLGCEHALASLFQVQHGLAWHNQRFYRDPVLARLEPILFDMGAEKPSERDPVPFRANDLTAAFAASPRYLDALFENLGRMLRSGWLDELFEALEPDARRFEAALLATGDLPPGFALDDMKQRLRAQAIWLRHAILPTHPAHFEATYAQDDPDGNPDSGVIEVRAWATTRSPVAIEGFTFSNGSFTAASACIGIESIGAHLRDGDVVLPVDGRSLVFRFPMDERLAHLERVEKVTRALREVASGAVTLDLDIQVVHRLLAAEDSIHEPLPFRRARHAAVAGADRPASPSLTEVLDRHPFLRYVAERDELRSLSGTWDVDGDLVLPDRVGLVLEPGTTLRFGAEAVLLATAPLRFQGSPDAPVVLEPFEGADRWRGVIVLEAGRSEWRDVVVRHTDAAARGGWIVTGGLTFYRSPLTLERCRIEGTLAEDGLNVFGADIRFTNSVFEGCSSDSFDGDFITGEIVGCTFQDGQADGIDVSGSEISVRDCRFLRLLDKGCSIGEDSHVRIVGGEVVEVGVGVASKDRSVTFVDGLVLRDVRHYALAAFVKKPAYGPARLVATDVRIEDAGMGRALSQTGCTLEIDGVLEPTQDVDVEASYREGILGRAK